MLWRKIRTPVKYAVKTRCRTRVRIEVICVHSADDMIRPMSLGDMDEDSWSDKFVDLVGIDM